MDDETAVREAFRGAALGVFEVVEQAIASRPATDWLGGNAIATAPLYDTPSLDLCVEAIEHSRFHTALKVHADEGFIVVDGVSASPTSARGIAHSVLTHAAAVLFWSGAGFDSDSFVRQVGATLDEVLRWLDDESESVGAIQVIALNNVFVSPGLSIDLPFGTLLPAPHTPAMPATHKLGFASVTIGLTDWDEAPSAILLRARPITARVSEQIDVESAPASSDLPAYAVADAVALAIVLACGHYDHSAPTFAGELMSQPLTDGAGSSSRSSATQRQPGIPIPDTVVADVQRYATRIADLEPTSILTFAGRRLVRSFNADHPEDSLVDAIVVWEVLFSGGPETTFKVTSAVASTLRNEFKDHLPLLDFQKLLSPIYAARSDIVHGNVTRIRKYSGKYDEFARNARRYSWYLLRQACLWPDETLVGDGEKRAKQAILGDWPPIDAIPEDPAR